MRKILVDWLCELHSEFRLAPETLFLCVYITDRYCGERVVSKRDLQLVGVAALLIACKYEEIYHPEVNCTRPRRVRAALPHRRAWQVRSCVYMTRDTYTVEELKSMELQILTALSFSVTVPTVRYFLMHYLTKLSIDIKASKRAHLAAYLSEQCLLEYEFVGMAPSLVAAAIVFFALFMDCEAEPVSFEVHAEPTE
jgi:hypothetical protein